MAVARRILGGHSFDDSQEPINDGTYGDSTQGAAPSDGGQIPLPNDPSQPGPGASTQPAGGSLTYSFDPSIGYYKGSDNNYYSHDPTNNAYTIVPGYSPAGTSPGFKGYANAGRDQVAGGGGDSSFGGNFDFSAPVAPGNVGNDPLSRSTDAKLQELIDNNGQVKDTNGQIEALNLERARGMADRARRAEMAGVDDTLANRGMLDQYDPAGGEHARSADYIERNDIAPLFSNAVQGYMVNDNNNASSRLTQALGDVTTRQGVLSNIALQSLAQNTAFQEFAATYGLQKDQLLESLKTGNDSNLINLLSLYLQQNGQLTKGFI